MADDPRDTQAQRLPDGELPSEEPATAPLDTTTEAVKIQAGSGGRTGTEAEADAGEQMTNEPIPVTEDEPGVGLTPADEESLDGMRGM